MKKPIACLSLLTAACVSAPLGAPDQTAQRIAVAIEEGDPDAASRLFARADSEDYRERMYPMLYGRAAQHYDTGDTAGAAALLAFMHEHYPESDAVAEALLYSVFLERASEGVSSEPDGATGTELDDALADVLEQDATPPVWVDLFRTQRAIDRGRLAEAREALDRFRGSWDGQPVALTLYVDDLERYLAGAAGNVRGNAGGRP